LVTDGLTDGNPPPSRRVFRVFATSCRARKPIPGEAARRAGCVAARANGYGLVTVPVIVRADQVTTVHLEGSPSWQNRIQLSQSSPVRLPGGAIAGWRANPEASAKP
jgi:hypothetical protein